MAKMKGRLNKKELMLAAFVIIGIIALFVNLAVALYRTNTVHTEMSFQNDTISRSGDINRIFNDMETMLSVFTSNIETLRANNSIDRDLVVQMQEDLLKRHTNIFGVSLIYEPNAFDAMDKVYKDNTQHSKNGVFMPHVWRNGNTYEIEPFDMTDYRDIYADARDSNFGRVRRDIYTTAGEPVPTLAFYLPMRDDTGKSIGLSVIYYETSFLEEYLQEHTYNDTICLIITDSNGNVVASSLKKESTSNDTLLSVMKNISELSISSLNNLQHIKTQGLMNSNYMMISNVIPPVKEQQSFTDDTQLILVHISEKHSLLGYIVSQGGANINILIALITVVSFVLLITSVFLRKKRDALTGLYGRDMIENDLPAVIKNMVAMQRDACLIMTDIDHFKRVNDTFGHMSGDIVLKNFAKIIMRCIRGQDWSARYGGEEFLIFLAGSDTEAGKMVAERIRAELKLPS